MMTPHQDWSLLTGAPVAPRVGPFATPEFLRVLWDHRALWANDEVELRLVADDGAAALQQRGGVVEFLGHQDLVDYRSPLGHGAGSIAKELARIGPGTAFRFDSLPVEAADEIERSLGAVGIEVTREQHALAAALELPATFDDYLAAIGKKERHETRRKRRRFEAEIGAAHLVTYRNDSRALDRFFELHRMAPGEKGEFMTAAMSEFFRALAGVDGWRLDGLCAPDGRIVAAAFSWSDREGYYLYNSAFDSGAGSASPGVVLVSMLIEQAIAEDLVVFDFLKGDETYKFRLGASERPLYVLEGRG